MATNHISRIFCILYSSPLFCVNLHVQYIYWIQTIVNRTITWNSHVWCFSRIQNLSLSAVLLLQASDKCYKIDTVGTVGAVPNDHAPTVTAGLTEIP